MNSDGFKFYALTQAAPSYALLLQVIVISKPCTQNFVTLPRLSPHPGMLEILCSGNKYNKSHHIHLNLIYSTMSYLLRVSCLKLEINEVRCYEAQIEESEKGRQPLGVEPRTPLALAASTLPLIHDSRTTTNPHNPLCILHRWY